MYGSYAKRMQWNSCFTWRSTLHVALLSACSSDADKIRYNGCPQQLIERICVSGKSVLRWIFVHTFHIYSPILAKFGVRELYVLLLVICDCRENGAGKAALFLRTWIKLHLRVCYKTLRHSECKERLGKVCVLRHGVLHLQSCWMLHLVVELNRNETAHGDAREGKWRGKMRIEWVASSLASFIGTWSIQ